MADDPRDSRESEGAGDAERDDLMTARLEAYYADMAAHATPPSIAELQVTGHDHRGSGLSLPFNRLLLTAAAVVAVVVIAAAMLARPGQTVSTQPGDAPGSTTPAVSTPGSSAVSEPANPSTTGPAGTGDPLSVTTTIPLSGPQASASSTTALNGPSPTATATTKAPNPNVSPPGVSTTTPVTTVAKPVCKGLPAGASFFDDFCSATIGQSPGAPWTLASGSWTVDAGTSERKWARNTTPGGANPDGRLAGGSATWTNYTVSARVRVAPGLVGVSARFQNANNYYFCKIGPAYGGLLWGVFENGSVLTTATTPFDAPVGSEWTIRFTVSGPNMTCAIDNGPAVPVQSDTRWASGAIALVAEDGGQFTDVEVR